MKNLFPEAPNYYILYNGDVIPANVKGAEKYLSSSYLFDTDTQRITAANAPTPAGRFKGIGVLGLSILRKDEPPIDISEWVGNIRANPPITLTARQLVVLWSKIHKVYIPKKTNLEVTDSLGEVMNTE